VNQQHFCSGITLGIKLGAPKVPRIETPKASRGWNWGGDTPPSRLWGLGKWSNYII